MGENSRGSSFAVHVAADKMTVRALYLFVLGFSGLFAMQGCGGGEEEPAAETAAETTVAATVATTSAP